MAKQGKIENITESTDSFEGSGVEAAKGADKSPSFDTDGATCVVTHRDGPKRVWFRDGKEIGVEDAG